MKNNNEGKLMVIVEKTFEHDGKEFLRGWRGYIQEFILIGNTVNAIVTYHDYSKDNRGFYVIPLDKFSSGHDLL